MSLIDLYIRDKRSGRIHKIGEDQHDGLWVDQSGDGMELIEYAPVAHGRWEHTHTSSSYYSECWKCSVCGFEDTEGYDFRFCPTCGAKMNLED